MRALVGIVMNTIPIIFNERRPTYTVVGGQSKAGSSGVSAILLNRGGRYLRRTVLQELEKCRFDSVVSVESDEESWELEELSQRFPFVKFLRLSAPATIGERVNLAVGELDTPRFFLLWNDLRLNSGTARTIARFEAESALCIVPILHNTRFELIPTLRAPVWFKRSLKPFAFSAAKEGESSLYPFDWIGLYDTEIFKRLGGFDPSLKTAYWQLLDFGFRAQLWGESIRATQLIRLSYDGETPLENSTLNDDYRLFYLKNLAPLYRGDGAHIPFRRFPAYLFRSLSRPLAAWREFNAARSWVTTNRYRFIGDARKITELWETPES